MSILSFPDRGPWAKASWPGNCSGYIYRELFERLKPRLVVDAMAGSNTAIDVAREMNIPAVGLDLAHGFNILRDSILAAIGLPACIVSSHPPYGSAIRYSGNPKAWGDKPHPDDLSHATDDADFTQKLHIALLNQREATRIDGFYCTILGDWRRGGVYSSYQAAAISMMPANELAAVLIKEQHNTTSARRKYREMTLPMITHEYVILWKKRGGTTYHLLGMLASAQARNLRGTWRAIVRMVMMELGGKARLDAVYEKVAAGCHERIQQNPHWKAKVRQLLNSSGEYTSTQRGEWALVPLETASRAAA